MNEQFVTLDVREDLRRGQEPFTKIMHAVAQLRPDQGLRLIAPFEPVPLFAVLARQGFSHRSKALEEGDWEVRFERGDTGTASPVPTPPRQAPQDSPTHCGAAKTVDVDARGLEPPQPLLVILKALSELPAGAEMRARTDRKPMHLFEQLLARGFTGRSEEQADGTYITHIRHR